MACAAVIVVVVPTQFGGLAEGSGRAGSDEGGASGRAQI